MVEFLDERNNVTMDVGSAKDASEWVNDIVNAQLAALQTNPTLYSGMLHSQFFVDQDIAARAGVNSCVPFCM